MTDWDDDNFEPQLTVPAVPSANKWEGEDEDDDVKDNWEDEDEEKEKKEEEPAKVEEKPKLKKKKLQDIVAEKERLRKEEIEKRARQMQEEEEEISPEERLRRQKESDLIVALETTFGDSDKNSGSIDSMFPNNKEEFDELSEALSKKLQPFSKNEEFPGFAENIIRNICATLTSNDLKKIKTTIDNLYLEKQKIEKGDKIKKKSKVKAKLRVDDNNLNQYSAYVDDYVDYDDFM
ncbi:eukaryotic translation initiation factor 3 subunit J [Agrilus planipennis]|uniref:Eukaryotic translation initiation factor 3 subunit J n=1 Tax=Agrilus planipennis TaxID=224129 RepID=A0A1W4WM53_AGRPL|nr:eukaryotic translation initiation factor 3 subunit J [Agrilus planipennis]